MNDPVIDTQQDRLAALYEASSQLGSSLDLTKVLNQAIDAIIKLTGAERGYIVLYDEVSGTLNKMVARNLDRQKIEGRSMELSRSVIEKAVATGQAIVTNNAQEDDRFSNQQSVVGFQLRSIMCAPLRVRNRTLGAVYVDNRLFSSVFNEDDLDLLVAFSNQAAIAIQNARLFTQTDQALARRAEEISLFQRIDQQLNKSLNLNRVLSRALDWSISLTDADGGSVGLLEGVEGEEEQVLRLLVSSNNDPHEDSQLVNMSHPILAQVLAEGRSVVTQDVSAEQAIDGTPAKTQLAVPIRRNGQITGLIALESQQSGALNDEDTAFVERLADRASVAIYNARLYERLQAANKAKSDFVSIVTHELRLPMTSIRGYADLLHSGMAGSLNEQQEKFLDVIRRNMVRMNDLIRDLGEINRIESGRFKFESQRFDIRELVAEVIDNLREGIGGRQQTLNVEMADGLPAVYADPTRVGQMMTNLLSNAHKYTPDGGEIILRIGVKGDFMEVSVIDNGLGISEEDQAKLFTQFFRAESQEVRQQQGWGLGLSIVKKMAEAHGGEVDFESTLGEGSRFTFTIPLATP